MDEAERLRKQAADAIARGADPAKVNARLQQLLSALPAQQQAPSPAPQNAPEQHEGSPSTLGAFARSFAATAANAAHGIPGMEALQAGARSLVRRQSYPDALSDIRGETGKIPAPLRIAGQLPGVVASTAIAPSASAVKVGAAYGGAQQALSADPMSLGERAGRTAVGAATGAFIPKAIQGIGTTGRVMGTAAKSMRAPLPATLLQRQEQKLQAETGPMYERALKEGQGAVVPPRVRAFLDRPDVKEISAGLRELDEYKGMADDSPQMIQAIDQKLTDIARNLKRGSGVVVGGKAATNTGRAEVRQVGELKRQLADVVSTPAPMMGPHQGRTAVTAGPMMPTYPKANRAYAKGKGEQQATKFGVNAVAAAERGRSAGGALDRSSPEAFEQWAKTKASPGEVDAFIQSVLGETGARVRSGLTPKNLGDVAVLPLLMRAGRSAMAGDRMIRSASNRPPFRVPNALTPTVFDLLQEMTR